MPKAPVIAVVLMGLALPALAQTGPQRAAELRRLLHEDCGSCHGLTLKGGLGSPLLPDAMAPLSEEAIAATILDGRPGTPMPPWRGMLSEDDARWLARTLRGDSP